MSLWKWSDNQWRTADLQDSARGLAAMLVFNGPSFKDIDVAQLAGPGRVVIGSNSVYPRLAKMDYWVAMDGPECHEKRVYWEHFPKVLRGGHQDKALGSGLLKEAPNTFFADVDKRAPMWSPEKFHWDWDTFLITLQFAHWIGCRTFYLVGVDLDNSTAHYADGNYLTPKQASGNAQLYEKQFRWLQKFQAGPHKQGITLVSCSPGSRINTLMPFVPLSEAVASIEAGVMGGREKPHVMAAADEVDLHLERGGAPYSAGHQRMYWAPLEFLKGFKVSILEVGFGIGFGLDCMLAADVVGEYWGCEASEKSFAHVRQKISADDARITLVQSAWPAPAPVMDYGFCIEVFEHLPAGTHEAFLSSLRQHVRKTLFLSTPDPRDSTHGEWEVEKVIQLLERTGWKAGVIRQQWTTMYVCS